MLGFLLIRGRGGDLVGEGVGEVVGLPVSGLLVGVMLGVLAGDLVGIFVSGLRVGDFDGENVRGDIVGAAVGVFVGDFVTGELLGRQRKITPFSAADKGKGWPHRKYADDLYVFFVRNKYDVALHKRPRTFKTSSLKNACSPSSPHNAASEASDLEATEPTNDENVRSVTSILSKSNRSDSLRLWKEREIARLGEDEFKRQNQETLRSGTHIHSLIQQYLTQEFWCIDEVEVKSGGEAEENSEDVIYSDGDPPPRFVHDDAIVPDLDSYTSKVQGFWKSVHPVLQEISRVDVVESSVFHSTLGYAGTIDCIAEYQGELRIIDWKTSRRLGKTKSTNEKKTM
eukprot:jgi/Bigna1/140953/aug1.59_g15661